MISTEQCKDCGAYDEAFKTVHWRIHRCPIYQRFIDQGIWQKGEEDCWHPIGTAKVWHEELERQAEGTQEAQEGG